MALKRTTSAPHVSMSSVGRLCPPSDTSEEGSLSLFAQVLMSNHESAEPSDATPGCDLNCGVDTSFELARSLQSAAKLGQLGKFDLSQRTSRNLQLSSQATESDSNGSRLGDDGH